jgi:hypothetical protein
VCLTFQNGTDGERSENCLTSSLWNLPGLDKRKPRQCRLTKRRKHPRQKTVNELRQSE